VLCSFTVRDPKGRNGSRFGWALLEIALGGRLKIEELVDSCRCVAYGLIFTLKFRKQVQYKLYI